LGEAVDELQVREDGGGDVLLVEEGLGLENVEGVAVGELHAGEGGFLGEDLVDVRREEGVCREERLAKRALNGGFELLLGRGGDAVEWMWSGGVLQERGQKVERTLF
jgi:hypothetical protein